MVYTYVSTIIKSSGTTYLVKAAFLLLFVMTIFLTTLSVRESGLQVIRTRTMSTN